MSNSKPAPRGKDDAQAAAPDSERKPVPKDLHSPRGSTGQQRAQQRADLAQHGVQIHERSRNVDRAGSGKK